MALGFFLPPILVKDHENIDDIGADLKYMFYIIAGVCTSVLLFVVIGKVVFLKNFKYKILHLK